MKIVLLHPQPILNIHVYGILKGVMHLEMPEFYFVNIKISYSLNLKYVHMHNTVKKQKFIKDTGRIDCLFPFEPFFMSM